MDGTGCEPKAATINKSNRRRPGLVTVPGNAGDDIAAGMLNNILKQAGLKP